MARRDRTSAQILLSGLVIVVVGVVAALLWLLMTSSAPSTVARSEVADGSGSTTTTEAPLDPNEASEAELEAEAERLEIEFYSSSPKFQVLVQPAGYEYQSPDNFFWYPTSTEFGPFEFTETRSSGFSRTPEGAALAAINIFYRSFPTNADFETTIAEQMIGPGRDARLERAREMVGELDIARESFAQREAPIGWDILEFNEEPGDARILVYYDDIASEHPATREIRVVWQDEDWRVVVPVDNFEADTNNTSGKPQDVNLEGAFR